VLAGNRSVGFIGALFNSGSWGPYNTYLSRVEEIERAIGTDSRRVGRIAQRVYELEQERWEEELDSDLARASSIS
jgi:hypothetical protein